MCWGLIMAGVQQDLPEAPRPRVEAVHVGSEAQEGRTKLVMCVIWGQCTWRTQVDGGQNEDPVGSRVDHGQQ